MVSLGTGVPTPGLTDGEQVSLTHGLFVIRLQSAMLRLYK